MQLYENKAHLVLRTTTTCHLQNLTDMNSKAHCCEDAGAIE